MFHRFKGIPGGGEELVSIDDNIVQEVMNLTSISQEGWESVDTLPYNFYQGSAVVYNNEIHILGSGNSSNYTKHYTMSIKKPNIFIEYKKEE